MTKKPTTKEELTDMFGEGGSEDVQEYHAPKKQEKWEDETLREWRKLWLEVVDLIVNSEGIVDLVEAETITEQFIFAQIRQARQREREVIVNKMLKIEKTKWHDCEHCTCLAYAIVSIFGEKYEKIIKGFRNVKKQTKN